MEMDEKLIADFACIDPVYVDGVAGILNLGSNFGMMFYRLVPVYSDGFGIRLEQVPALYVVRPKASVTLCAVIEGCPFRAIMGAPRMPFGLTGAH